MLTNGKDFHYLPGMTFESVREIIDLWPTRADLASDLSDYCSKPVSAPRVHKWARAGGGIPAEFHAGVIACATLRGFAVSAEDLVRLHDVRQEDTAA